VTYKHRLQLAIHRFLTLPALLVVVSLSAEYRRRVRTEATLGGFAGLLVLAAVYLMVTKAGP
jgi:hypothetical protein